MLLRERVFLVLGEAVQWNDLIDGPILVLIARHRLQFLLVLHRLNNQWILHVPVIHFCNGVVGLSLPSLLPFSFLLGRQGVGVDARGDDALLAAADVARDGVLHVILAAL